VPSYVFTYPQRLFCDQSFSQGVGRVKVRVGLLRSVTSPFGQFPICPPMEGQGNQTNSTYPPHPSTKTTAVGKFLLLTMHATLKKKLNICTEERYRFEPKIQCLVKNILLYSAKHNTVHHKYQSEYPNITNSSKC